jgi:excisionase family DNA binding protein
MGRDRARSGGDRAATERRRATVPEAAELLGISVEAVRSRIKRGTLESAKDSGRTYVLLDAAQMRPVSDQALDRELIDELRDRVRSLERRLDEERVSSVELKRIIAALTERIPELPAPISSESPGSPIRAAEVPEGLVGPVAEGTQTTSEVGEGGRAAPVDDNASEGSEEAESSQRAVVRMALGPSRGQAVVSMHVWVIPVVAGAIAALVVAAVSAINSQFFVTAVSAGIGAVLILIASRQQVRYARVHERRDEALGMIFGLLVNCDAAFHRWAETPYASDETPAQMDRAGDLASELHRLFIRNIVWVPDAIAKELRELLMAYSGWEQRMTNVMTSEKAYDAERAKMREWLDEAAGPRAIRIESMIREALGLKESDPHR